MSFDLSITITAKAENTIRIIHSNGQTMPVVDYLFHTFKNALTTSSESVCKIDKYDIKDAYEITNDFAAEIHDSNVSIKDNSFYHFGWKQIYNRFFFLDTNQKKHDLHFKNKQFLNDFYHLNKLIAILESSDIEFTMTAFSFILFSTTKSLYKASANSSVKDIHLSVIQDPQINDPSFTEKLCSILEDMIKTIVDEPIYVDFTTGTIKKPIIKESRITIPRKESYFRNLYPPTLPESSDSKHKKKVVPAHIYKLEDYPVLIHKKGRVTKYPSKQIYSNNASPIFINYHHQSEHHPSTNITLSPKYISTEYSRPYKTRYINYLENKLTNLAEEEYSSKAVNEDMKKIIENIIEKKDEINPLITMMTNSEIRQICNSIFRQYYHRKQHVPYFDDLYKKANKILSFPNCDKKLVSTYSYLLASLMSFKEYVDMLPVIPPDEADEENSEFIRQPKLEFADLTYAYGLPSDGNYKFYDEEDADDREINTTKSKSSVININSYKDEFNSLFYQTIDIFKRQCAVNSHTDINLTYNNQLILYFDQFINDLMNKNSDLIIIPDKNKSGLIFLDYHKYFDQFELFLARKCCSLTISKQKFNRLLYDNMILKPRYNGNEKTPPKLDYILQSNGQKYTVLAIRLDILTSKCSELSTCP